MPSPVPRFLREEVEHGLVPSSVRDHVVDLNVGPVRSDVPSGGPRHAARFAPGLVTQLVRLAETDSLGDPMAGTGMLGWESGRPVKLNDLDPAMSYFLDPLLLRGCAVSYLPADQIQWTVEAAIFSPPYYPRTDRCVPNAHDDAKRGPVVGFRDSYGCTLPGFIGNPGGVNAVRMYREAMTKVYEHLLTRCTRMIVVTKNWWRLGTELRLDLDTILMCMEVGWICEGRHGWEPPPSLWSRFNAQRGGFQPVEDVLLFKHP